MKVFLAMIVWCVILTALGDILAGKMEYTFVPWSFPWLLMCGVNGWFAVKISKDMFGEKREKSDT